MRGLPWQLLPSTTPIQPLVVGANADALALAAALWQRGFWMPAIRPPTVPVGTARLRITLSAAHALRRRRCAGRRAGASSRPAARA